MEVFGLVIEIAGIIEGIIANVIVVAITYIIVPASIKKRIRDEVRRLYVPLTCDGCAANLVETDGAGLRVFTCPNADGTMAHTDSLGIHPIGNPLYYLRTSLEKRLGMD